MDKILALITITTVGCLITAIPFIQAELKEEVLGKITSFQVSAGGFGHSDLCTVIYDDNYSIVLSGSCCHKLESGKTLVRETKVGGFIITHVYENYRIED